MTTWLVLSLIVVGAAIGVAAALALIWVIWLSRTRMEPADDRRQLSRMSGTSNSSPDEE